MCNPRETKTNRQKDYGPKLLGGIPLEFSLGVTIPRFKLGYIYALWERKVEQ